MAHPLLAIRDPLYWISLFVLIGTALTIVLSWLRPSWRPWVRPRALAVMLALCLPSGCYALLGTACYVGGDCP